MTRPLLNINTATYDPAKAARICELLSQGITLASILRDEAGMPSRWSVHRWKADRPEFKEASELARDVGYDAIAEETAEGRVFGYRFRGQRYDCGSKAGFLQATVAFGLSRPDLRDEFSAYLHDMIALQKAAQ